MATRSRFFSRSTFNGGTLAFLAGTVGLAVTASVIGFSDNPPGIILLYGAGLSLVLAFTHRWREPDRFGILLVGSVIGFFLMVVLHNFAEVGAERLAFLPALSLLLNATSVVGFFAAVIICPAAVLVGLLGFTASFAHKRRAASV